MILGIQIIALFSALGLLYYTYIQYKKKALDTAESFFWFIVWIVFITITLIPDILTPFTRTLALSRRMDVLILFGFVTLTALLFKTHVDTLKNQKELVRLVRELAIKKKK